MQEKEERAKKLLSNNFWLNYKVERKNMIKILSDLWFKVCSIKRLITVMNL